MDKELLLKDGLLGLVFAFCSVATGLVWTADVNKMYIGAGLYVLAAALMGLRTWLKGK